MHNFHILYLDNDSSWANQVKMRLEWQGYQVAITDNEQELLSILHQQTYDLLIVDLLTPTPNAFSLLEYLTTQSLILPTILVSDAMDNLQVNKALHFGCISYVLKNPFFQKFFEQISVSIFQAREQQHAMQTTQPKNITHQDTETNKITWEYFPLQDLVHWLPEQKRAKLIVSYDDFTAKIHLEDLAHVKTQNNICLFAQSPVEYSFRYLTDDKKVVTYQIQIHAEVDITGTVNRLYGTMQKLSTEQHSDKNVHLKLSFLDNTSDGVFITNTHNQIISVNKAFTMISGYSEQEIIKQNTDILNAAHFNADFFKTVVENLKSDNFWQGEVLIRHRDGHIVPIW
ncbi:MAG: response regulator, partial [Methyloprofundus sp.]|nr:response regulator [Methyloprofundus sp.]